MTKNFIAYFGNHRPSTVAQGDFHYFLNNGSTIIFY